MTTLTSACVAPLNTAEPIAYSEREGGREKEEVERCWKSIMIINHHESKGIPYREDGREDSNQKNNSGK